MHTPSTGAASATAANSPAYDERRRLAILDSYGILDTPPEEAFDDVVKLVSQLLHVPIAAVNLIAEGRQWFKSEVGLGTREMPLDDSICKFALLEERQMIVPDTLEDARFSCNPLVAKSPGLRFYAGALLKTQDGVPLGTLCALDLAPRPQGLSPEQEFALSTLAHQVMSQIELRKALRDQERLIARQAADQEDLRASRVRALATARQAEDERRRLDALLDAAPVAIIMADAHGAIVKVNAENRKLWGGHPASPHIADYAQWQGWWADGSARHGQQLQAYDWSLARALHGEEAPRQIVEIASFDQPPVRRTILNSGAPVRDEHGTIIGAVIAQMDITDRVEAEAALRRADQKKDEFLAMLAHELRNPLAPIASAAALLSMARIDEGGVRRASAIISRQVGHMTALIDDLLDVSRVTQGKVELDKVELDMKDVIADAIEQVRPLVERHGHRLVVALAPAPAGVVGDRKRLVQVMANLLSNAAKYTPDGGRIEVDLENRPGDATLSIAIRDNGIGMTPDLIASAFELFSQGAQGLDRSQGGLGIGLSLVRSLLRLHGGAVAASSAGTGQGTTMHVTLPKAASGAAGHAGDGTHATPLRGRPLRIAIVDDNEDAALMLAMFLETAGHAVAVAHSAGTALERLPDFRPDVCLLDIGLPDLSGFELARALRGASGTAGATLIAVSGYAQEKDREQALAAGFGELLAKPVDLHRLDAALAAVARD